MGRTRRACCTECPASFTRNGDLLIHKFVEHEGGRFVCPICQRGLKSKRGLKFHIQAHTNRGEFQQPPGQPANVQPPNVEETAPTSRRTRSNTRQPTINQTAGPLTRRLRSKTKSAAPKEKHTNSKTSKSKKPAATRKSTRTRKRK